MGCIGTYKKRSGRSYPTTKNRRDHIIVAEQALGRPLPRGVIVHHFNRQIRDSRNANLVICQDQAYHTLLHARQRVKDAGGNPNTDKICHRCRQVKSKSEFSPSSSRGIQTLASACKECAAGAQQRRRLLRQLGQVSA